MNDRILNLSKLFVFALIAFSCAKKAPVDPPIARPTPPGATTPFTPPVVHPVRMQFNSGGGIGTTTNAYKTRLSLGNNSATQSGTTTNGFRVQYNVQSPNDTR